jgi:hypothetical protein
MPEERLVYGCVGADRPEAQPFIEEIDGILLYVCPKCRKELERSITHYRGNEAALGRVTRVPHTGSTDHDPTQRLGSTTQRRRKASESAA